ncbi:ABC transporter permease [Marinobacter changyiensis]|uniref:ABC transporter permease n=1 Tax=Marinobacter changyiensis TaxID=2604091 RepID=UPI00126435D2|nr:ABC transporter permease [Marinobacter changyiensis]
MNLTGALLSHYRRHPWQLLALLLILIVATALWSSVWQLSQQARNSFTSNEAALEERFTVLRTDGNPVTVTDFATLRRLGFCISPQLTVERPAPEGRIIGIDALALRCFGDISRQGPSGQSGVFVDIGEAEKLAGDQWPTRLTLFASRAYADLPPAYRIASVSSGVAAGQLADSFLLNLDALCALVLLISALLVRSVFLLGLAQRELSLALLHRFGVTPGRLQFHLVVELAVLSAIGGTIGLVLGQVLASGFGQGFDQALSGLYGVRLYAQETSWLAWLAPLLVLILVMIWAVADRVLFSTLKTNHRLLVAVASTLLLIGVGSILWSESLTLQFLAIGLTLAGFGWLTALMLPELLNQLADTRAKPLTGWSWRELAVMVRQLALPLVALQFAAATVIAIHALVATFENTFYDWLDQRLQGDVYLQAPPNLDRAAATAALARLDSVRASHGVIRGEAQTPYGTMELMAVNPASSLLQAWTFLASNTQAPEEVWRAVEAGAVLVNEQLARREQLTVGDPLTFAFDGSPQSRTIAGIYADYGRPAGEILISHQLWPPEANYSSLSFSVTLVSGSLQTFRRQIEQAWNSPGLTIRDNAEIRALAVAIFDQTFALTRALSALTLALAGFALLLMALTMFGARKHYYQKLQLWGMPEHRVKHWLMRHSTLLTVTVGATALPLGVFLTWVLVARINPLAFGWSLPMAVFPMFWLFILGLCLAIGLLLARLLAPQIALRAGRHEG